MGIVPDESNSPGWRMLFPGLVLQSIISVSLPPPPPTRFLSHCCSWKSISVPLSVSLSLSLSHSLSVFVSVSVSLSVSPAPAPPTPRMLVELSVSFFVCGLFPPGLFVHSEKQIKSKSPATRSKHWHIIGWHLTLWNAAAVVAYPFSHPECFSCWNLQDCMCFQGMESSASWVERNTFWMWQRSLWGRKSTMTSSSNAQSGSIHWATWTTKSTWTWCSTRWVTQESIVKTCTCGNG